MSGILKRGVVCMGCVAMLALAGCGSNSLNRAPVEDRGAAVPPAPVVVPVVKPPPGFENAGKPGYYTVKPGDTLIRIGLENGQSHKDISRWNALENPNKIEVGQVLRVVPPVNEPVVVAKPVSSGVVTATPLPSTAAATASAPAKAASAPAPAASAAAPVAASVPAKAVAVPAAPTGADEDLGWIWPGKGPVIAEFDESKNKGVDISGAAGDAVLAAADGKVVYAGAGLRGYGNLIILKHNNTYLTAYAHNQSLMVKEDQSVKKGQKIAEMGNSDADRVKLHFEVRRQGKPVDPLKYLPAK
ncbi:MAG: peptidoglycan DD-metalloendopeptidase family protein [Rhodoferax sp.]|nr:peptidoglycan DD-metalloendopeptidase family protein [Rhodoferax sp.]